MGLSLPSVSRKVAELERYLGTNLLVRTSRNIQLTDAGRDYVEAARRIIADLEETERRASGEYQTPRRQLSITTPIEFGARHVIPIALSFMQEYPEVTLNLITSDRLVHLVDEHVDIAVRLGHLADSAAENLAAALSGVGIARLFDSVLRRFDMTLTGHAIADGTPW